MELFRSFLAATISFGFSCFALAEVAKPWMPSAFSAELISYHVRHPERASKVWVTLSRHGVRLAAEGMFGDDQKGLYLQNFLKNKSWAVRPNQGVFAELPIDDESVEDESGFSSNGVMATSPCMGYGDQKVVESVRFVGEDVVKWHCGKGSEQAVQYFSTKWGVVIKEEMPNELVTELRRMREVEVTEAFFTPNQGFVSVSMAELVMGFGKLDNYSTETEERKIQ